VPVPCIVFQAFRDGGLEGMEFAGALSLDRTLPRRSEVFLDRSPTHAEMSLDLADRPTLGPLERYKSLICSGESMSRFPLSGGNRIHAMTLLLARFGLRAAVVRKHF
jgi:hypothetical protein